MRTMILIIVACLPLLAGCATSGTSAPSSYPLTTSEQPVTAPPRPRPARVASCPYLDKWTVAYANGQRVGSVRVSGGDPPACFFYRPDGRLQMSVWVYKGTPALAHAIIDRAAPVATSDKATDPAGWTGGSQPTGSGAVYAVLRKGTAVVVTTNQRQTIKAREIATEAISALRL